MFESRKVVLPENVKLPVIATSPVIVCVVALVNFKNIVLAEPNTFVYAVAALPLAYAKALPYAIAVLLTEEVYAADVLELV